MDFQNHNDLVPRPSPKPSQIEVPVIPSKPEVPEVSLLFDTNSQDEESARMQLIKNLTDQKQTKPMHVSQPHIVDQIRNPTSNLDTTRELLGNMKCASSRIPGSIQKFDNFFSPTRRVSFSPPMANLNLPGVPSVPCYSEVTDQYSNCSCGSNLESHKLNGYITLADQIRNNRCMNLNYDEKNEMFAKSQCTSFLPCAKYHEKNCDYLMNRTISYVTLDEYQNMVSRFFNMISNLHRKFDQMVDNFITREEMNQITEKLEFKIENLTQRVDKLNLELEKERKESNLFQNKYYKTDKSIDDRLKHNTEAKRNENYQNFGKDSLPPMENSPIIRENINNLIEKAVLEQLRKNSISVEELKQQNRYQEDNLVPNHEFSSGNVVASSDMSILMNSLAKKYIPEGQSDFKNRDERRQRNDMITHNNCNNVSTATLQYMERYQLLSIRNENSEKPEEVNAPKSSSNQQFNYREILEGNDRSFVC